MDKTTIIFLLLFSFSALTVQAIDTDNDGFSDELDAFPLDPALPALLSNGQYIYDGLSENGSGSFGSSVASAGDVNADGYPDFVIGDPDFSKNGLGTEAGMVQVISGYDGLELYSFYVQGTGNRLGSTVRSAGDVNNDGYGDIIAGMPGDGKARVYSGLDGAILYEFTGDEFNNFGSAVDGAGDINADGYDDVIIGTVWDDGAGTNAGRIRVYSGLDGSSLYTFLGDNDNDLFGSYVSGMGDINKDGYADFSAGALHDDNNGSNSGSVTVFSGKNGNVLMSFDGDSANDLCNRVENAGDVDGDNWDDIVVGCYGDSYNDTQSGAVWVYSGKNSQLLHVFRGASAYDQLGWSADGAGDINNDGYDDVVVGSRYEDDPLSNSGAVRVFSGADGSVLYKFSGNYSDGNFGASVSGIGDINNDGTLDLLIGASKSEANWKGRAYVITMLIDSDGDGIEDVLDNDIDGDGFSNAQETNRFFTNPLGVDLDGDGDGVPDSADFYPTDPTRYLENQLLLNGEYKGGILQKADIFIEE